MQYQHHQYEQQLMPHLMPHQQQQQQQQQQQPTMMPMVETKYMMSRPGPLGNQSQANAAAAFFAKAHQRLQHQQFALSASASPRTRSRKKRSSSLDGYESSEERREQFPTNFRALVHKSPPQVPSGLLKALDLSEAPSGMGKIRVFVRVSKAVNCFDPQQQQEHSRHFQVDGRRKQLTLYDPGVFRGLDSAVAIEERKLGVAAPKMFAFDGLFTSEDSHEAVCAAALPEVIQAVMNGIDGCLFCFGHANLGKTRTMLGSDECSRDMGAIPIAIAWLYKAIKEKKAKNASKFSIRVSALEITSQREEVRDLLAPFDTQEGHDQSPGALLRSLPLTVASPGAGLLQKQAELRASSAEKAAYYLDAALASRSLDAQGRESHLIFTIHIYQCSTAPGQAGVSGGRSRLHLIDFGGCERTRTPGGGITLSGLGNVILGIFNGQKHLPHRDSKVTQILKECLGSLTCQAAMLAHVSPEANHYSETLHTAQLASRLHRMRRKRMKAGGSGSGSTSSDEHRRLRRMRSRGSGSSGRSSSDLTSGTSTNASSSDMSCDTVVYRGQSDGSGTDCEHPPFMLPSLRLSSGGSSCGSSAPGSLRGSLDEIPRPRRRSSGSKILTNGAIASPRRTLSPQFFVHQPQTQPHHVRSPHRSLSSLPVIHEVNTNSRKMPLNGLVPVLGRQRMRDLSAPPPTTTKTTQEQWVDVRPGQSDPFSARKEVWIDGHDQQQLRHASKQQQQKSYGFMDDHKASMISTWVESQQSSQSLDNLGGFRALTQFKTCESSQADVIVHSQQPPEEKAGRKCPPPPPPRRTPPRSELIQQQAVKDPLNSLVAECNQLAEALDRSTKTNTMMMNDAGRLVNDDDLSRQRRSRSQEPDDNNKDHPLRILSEENLTVVSSFTGSLGDINAVNEHDEVDPSKLSFFEVPDFGTIKEDMDKQDNFISERFRQFAQLERSINNNNNNQQNDNSPTSTEVVSEIKRDQVVTTGNQTSHKVNNNNYNSSNTQVSRPSLTPQKQFLLLAQSLRHPDGSSNPELNEIVELKRSPGNGRSEPDEDRVNQDNGNVDALDISPCDNDQVKTTSSKPVTPAKKESGRFAFRFLKIFGSTRRLTKSQGSSKTTLNQPEANNSQGRRSKSCDRKTDFVKPVQQPSNGLVFSQDSAGLLRGAKSSPSLRLGKSKEKLSTPQPLPPPPDMDITTPSILSMSTEWEYEDKENGNSSSNNVMSHQLTVPKHYPIDGKRTDRKSSGYDSLGGESSSLDSNEDPILRAKLLRCESPSYALPPDKDIQILQYDELDIIRMEQRRRLAHAVH